MKKEIAEKATNWWVDKIIALDHHDNGAKDDCNKMAMLMMDVIASNNAVSKSQILIFKESLIKDLISCKRDFIVFGVDYNPDEILYNAIKKAKINACRLPIKTYMKINNDKIFVSEGYGSSYLELH